MFIPFGDFPNPPKPQWVTRTIVALNIAIYLFVTMPLEGQPLTKEDLRDPEIQETLRDMADAQGERDLPLRAIAGQVSKYDVFTFRYGYKPGKPDLLALFFCMFLHGGFLHLAGNMLFLWIFGDNVEARFGPVGYLVTYLATGVVATLSFALPAGDSMIPLVGASGAISGVLGCYLLWFPHNQIRVLFIFFFIHVIHIRAYWVLLFYLFVDNVLPLLVQRGMDGGGVAHGAHIGGFVAGAAVAWTLQTLRGGPPPPRPGVPRHQRARWGSPQARQMMQRAAEDVAQVFATAIREGRMEEAAHSFARLAREGGRPPEPDHVFRLGQWLYENGFVPDAQAVFRFYVKNFPRGDDLDRVHLGLGILLARRLGRPAAAREHLLTAIDLGDPGIAALAREELARIEEG